MPMLQVDGVQCGMCGHKYAPVKSDLWACPKCLKEYEEPPKPCKLDGWQCRKCGHKWPMRGGVHSDYVRCSRCKTAERTDRRALCPECGHSFLI